VNLLCALFCRQHPWNLGYMVNTVELSMLHAFKDSQTATLTNWRSITENARGGEGRGGVGGGDVLKLLGVNSRQQGTNCCLRNMMHKIPGDSNLVGLNSSSWRRNKMISFQYRIVCSALANRPRLNIASYVHINVGRGVSPFHVPAICPLLECVPTFIIYHRTSTVLVASASTTAFIVPLSICMCIVNRKWSIGTSLKLYSGEERTLHVIMRATLIALKLSLNENSNKA